MKRAYSPKEIAKKTYKTLPWGGRWEESFGLPEENSTWFISGASASGKSSFVMQLAYELTHYGQVLYLSYEEGLNQSFQERMLRFDLDKNIIVDSFQDAGWEWPETKALLEAFPKKSFIFISQEAKGQPLGKPAVRLRYRAGVKVRVVGFRAYCQGRFNPDAGNSFIVWEEGVLRTTNNV